MSDALKKLKVVELASVLAGPSVGMFFAEHGSQVIKVENPGKGDVTRSWKLPEEDKNSNVSAYFSSVNWNKKYVGLDLKTSEGRSELMELLSDADVLLTNFKNGDDEKFGTDYESLKKKFPKLIIGAISGFGDESDRVAYDLILQAESGFMHMNGQADGPPTKIPVALIDVLAAHQLKEGLLVALLERELTGKGRFVSASLYDAALASLSNQASNYLMAGHIPERIGSLHPNICPYGEIFTASCGMQITFAVGSTKQFGNLCKIIGLPALVEDERFCDNPSRVVNRAALKIILQQQLDKIEGKYLLAECHKVFVPIGQIKNLKEVFSTEDAMQHVLEETIDGVATKRVKTVVYRTIV